MVRIPLLKKLLVALDGSPHSAAALAHALSLAAAAEATVTGIHIVDAAAVDTSFVADLSGSLGFQPFLNLNAELHDALRTLGRTVLADFEQRAAEARVSAHAVLAEGFVVSELLRAARDHDLVFLGAHGTGQKRGKLLGGHADALLRRLDRPAWLAPALAAPISRPLAAFDGSEKSRRALVLAAELARLLSVRLDVLTVSAEPAEISARRALADDLLHEHETPHQFRAAPGHPEEAILAALRDHDLIAIGSHGHGRIVELFLGSTTERILRRATVPVLCVP